MYVYVNVKIIGVYSTIVYVKDKQSPTFTIYGYCLYIMCLYIMYPIL